MSQKYWFNTLAVTSERKMRSLQEEHAECMDKSSDAFVADIMNPKSAIAEQMKTAANKGHGAVGIDIHRDFRIKYPCVSKRDEFVSSVEKKLKAMPDHNLHVCAPACWGDYGCSPVHISWEKPSK